MRYTVKAAAAATGVAEDRLRTWERRYGVPSPERSPTGRRLYSEADLALIRRMSSLVDAGVGAAEAAEAARLETAGIEAGPLAAPEPPDDPLVGELVEAAVAFDEEAARRVVRQAVAERGWGAACDAVLFPGMRRVGEAWQAGTLVTSNEHFVSEVIRGELWSAVSRLTPPSASPLVLLALPPRERHDLGLLALTLVLREVGVRAVFLGADVPVADLLAATERTGAAAICLSAVTAPARSSLEVEARQLVASGQRAQLFVGGPALADAAASASIPGVRLPGALVAAARVVAERVGAPGSSDTRGGIMPSGES